MIHEVLASAAKYKVLRNLLVHYFQFQFFSEAENLADEVILRLLRKASGLNPKDETEVTKLALGFAHNVAKECRRERARTGEYDPDFDPPDSPPADGLPWEVDDCLARLSPADRELLDRYYGDGLTAGEIADSGRLSENNVRVRVKRALDSVRKCVSAHGWPPKARIR